MTTEEATPITLPPDLRAMVEAILGLCRDLTVRETGDVHGGSVLATATSRLRVIYDTAQRLEVALEQREAVMGDMAKALTGQALSLDCLETICVGLPTAHREAADSFIEQIAAARRAALAKYEAHDG